MKRFQAIGCSLALLIGAAGVRAQVPSSAHVYVGEQLPAPRAALGQPVALETAAPAGVLSSLGAPFSLRALAGGDGGSCCANGCCDDGAKWGPTLPEDVKLCPALHTDCWRVYGWVDMGYTGWNQGRGLMSVEPRENRFGDEWLFNQIAVVLEKPLKGGPEFNWGFNATFYAGADAALLRPRGGFTTEDPRFGADFRQLYVSGHLPILSEGGVDVKVGRMGTIIGWESALAPYRPFYSNDYQWFYGEDGAFTGALATWHVNKQLDITNGITMGANTFFTLRGNGPCYIGQVNYWLQEDKRTMLSSSVYVGNQAIFSATPPGDTTVTLEFMVTHNWNKYLTQVIQSDNGWEDGIPNGAGGTFTGQWWSLYNIFVFHATPMVDLTNRVEWFDDVNSSRIGTAAHNYGEVTFGFDFHPRPWVRIRPEGRYDFADDRAFANGTKANQWTVAFDVLFQY